MNKSQIFLSPPHMGCHERKYVEDTFLSNWIAPLGPNVDGFEQDIAHYTGCGHVAVLNSGTAAIHLALILLNVQKGDSVICPTMSFTASAAPITYLGAKPVFVDSEKDTFNICPKLCEEAIKKLLLKNIKPKAIIIVHLFGMPCNIPAFIKLSKQYEIPLIEDAAEALGSKYGSNACGTMGDFGIYSFNGNKIITTGGGGALVSSNEDHIKKARYLATHAREPELHYQHSEVGYNYRLSNVSAAIGRGQMEVLNDRVNTRRAHFERYQHYFSYIPSVSMQKELNGDYFSNRWLSTIVMDSTCNLKKLFLEFKKHQIETRPLWKPLHLQPAYTGATYIGGSTAEKLFNQGLCLPSGSNLSNKDFRRIFSVFKLVFGISEPPFK